MEPPRQIAVLEITAAEGREFTLIVTEFDFTHPFEFVSVRVYVVAEAGDTVGLEFAEANPLGELVHE